MILLDGDKAFDNLNWNFMLHQLEVLQVGERFLKLIKAIYTQQKAKVRINGELTKEIQIQKGTKWMSTLSITIHSYSRNIN